MESTNNPFRIRWSLEFKEWYFDQCYKTQLQIDKRLNNIKSGELFGEYKLLTHNLYELKWKNGRRIYFCYASKLVIILLLGGNKNGQDKDIRKAKALRENYIE